MKKVTKLSSRISSSWAPSSAERQGGSQGPAADTRYTHTPPSLSLQLSKEANVLLPESQRETLGVKCDQPP